MTISVEVVIYRDKRYPSSWIDEKKGYPDKIANFLREKGFRIINADELKEFMIKSLEQDNAYEKLVIFAQDVIPDTIAEEGFSNITLREFLDQGGSILWIGDIPGFYIGKKEKKFNEVWKFGAPVYMLGIVPLFADSVKTTVKITEDGKRLGLTHKWSGTRPILPDSGIKPLAQSEIIFAYPYLRNIVKKDIADLLKRPTRESEVKEFESEFGSEAQIPLISRIFARVKPRFTKVEEKEPPEIDFQYLHETFINAWFKNYNEDYHSSGFYRIWDYRPRNLTSWMLNELYAIINNICKRLEKQIKED